MIKMNTRLGGPYGDDVGRGGEAPLGQQLVDHPGLSIMAVGRHGARARRQDRGRGATVSHSRVNCVPNVLQSSRDPSTGWHRRRRRNGTANQL